MINSEDFLNGGNGITQFISGYTMNGGTTRKALPTPVKKQNIDITTGSDGHDYALVEDGSGYVTALDVSWYTPVQGVNQFFKIQVRGEM